MNYTKYVFTKQTRMYVCVHSLLAVAGAGKSKWLADSVKRINFNLRRIRDKLSAGRPKN